MLHQNKPTSELQRIQITVKIILLCNNASKSMLLKTLLKVIDPGDRSVTKSSLYK